MAKRTTEERLLDAIYGIVPKRFTKKCSKCRRVVIDPLYYNEKPYHLQCLPHSSRR